MSNKRAPITEGAQRPELKGRPIAPGEVLEILSGGQWRQVTLDRSKDRYKRWVLRFVDQPTVSVLAIGTPARRPSPARRP